MFGLLNDDFATIIQGYRDIVMNCDILITDYISIGGIGACFVNSGLVTLASIAMLYLLRVNLSGRSMIAIFLMSGFALFGKNIANIWLIVIGTYIYAKIKRERFADYVVTALLGTSMAPAITEIMLFIEQPMIVRVILTLVIGLGIGFLLPPLSAHTISFHQGYNLYNVGFAAGLLGTVIVSLAISYGYETRRQLVWSTGNNLLLGSFLVIIFLFFIITGFILNKKSFHGLSSIIKSNGRLHNDFVEANGFGLTLINMGINGYIGLAYVLFIKAPLNGPTIGGILTIVGFGAYGKHIRNMVPTLVGVFIGVITKIWGMDDPRLIIAALFGTALAPIAGEFGWFYGVIAGFINSSVVLNVGALHGGLNLYNTGFSSGIVAAILVPMIRAFKREPRNRKATRVNSIKSKVSLADGMKSKLLMTGFILLGVLAVGVMILQTQLLEESSVMKLHLERNEIGLIEGDSISDGVNRPDDQDIQNGQNLQDSQNSQYSQDPQYSQDTQDNEDIQNTQSSQNPQNPQDSSIHIKDKVEVSMGSIHMVSLEDLTETKLITADHLETVEYPLVAMIEEQNLYFYGAKDGVILKQGNAIQTFTWDYLTPRFILPRVMASDFDRDGVEEILCIFYVGSGTGVSIDDLHILEPAMDEQDVKLYYDHPYVVKDYIEELSMAIQCSYNKIARSFYLTVGNDYHEFAPTKEMEGFTFDRMAFGNIINFDYDNGIKLIAEPGFFFEEIGTPFYVGYVTADIIYDESGFKLNKVRYNRH